MGRLRLPLIFFLQLLLLTLLILALGEPVFSLRVSNVAIVLDNSASMQTLENQQTRFALAQEKARELLADVTTEVSEAAVPGDGERPLRLAAGLLIALAGAAGRI